MSDSAVWLEARSRFHHRRAVRLEFGGIQGAGSQELDLLVDDVRGEIEVVPVDPAAHLQVCRRTAHREAGARTVDGLALAVAEALVEAPAQQITDEERVEEVIGGCVEELVAGLVPDRGLKPPLILGAPASRVVRGDLEAVDGAGGDLAEGPFGEGERLVPVQIPDNRDRHGSGRVVPVVEPAQVRGSDPPEARPVVREGIAQALDPELPLPEVGRHEPPRGQQRGQMVEELAGAGADLVLHRLAPALHHLRLHGVRGHDPRQPLDGEEPVLPPDGDVVPGVVAVGAAVAPAAEPLHRVLDLLFGAAFVVGEQHMLGEVGELLLATGIGVGPHRDPRAYRDVGDAGQVLEPDPDAVGERVGLEAGEGVGGVPVGGRRGCFIRLLSCGRQAGGQPWNQQRDGEGTGHGSGPVGFGW